MAWISGVPQTSRVWARARRPVAWALLALLGGGAACSSDGEGEGEQACVGGGGPVLSAEPDDHCQGPSGMDRVQSIGSCVTMADEGDADEEEMGVFFGREADDDDCKYHISFTNTCITQNQPVTFTVKLTRKSDGAAAPGAVPVNPEVFMETGSHVSPSNTFTAPEGPPGTYAIGPVVFDRAGRWVVRFHFFETCSDIPEDSPHGHTAFYIDVP